MNYTIMKHNGDVGGVFCKYNIITIQKVENGKIRDLYNNANAKLKLEALDLHERKLFHGTNEKNLDSILRNGLDERFVDKGMFGPGIYFAEHSSKSNQYVFGKSGCPSHGDMSCYSCPRKMLYCQVMLGSSKHETEAQPRRPHAPENHHSVTGIPTGVKYTEYVIYRGEQAYPEYVITYQIVK